jgi:HSP20 family protein
MLALEPPEEAAANERRIIMKNGKAVAVQERKRALLWPEEFETLFDRAARGLFPRRRLFPTLSRQFAWLPDMDVFDREGKTVVRMDLPGMKREDIEVSVEGGMLTVHGHRAEEKEVKEENYYCAERATGEFSRTITLPEGVATDAIEATYKDGILEVVVPKPVTEQPAPTKVDVK